MDRHNDADRLARRAKDSTHNAASARRSPAVQAVIDSRLHLGRLPGRKTAETASEKEVTEQLRSNNGRKRGVKYPPTGRKRRKRHLALPLRLDDIGAKETRCCE